MKIPPRGPTGSVMAASTMLAILAVTLFIGLALIALGAWQGNAWADRCRAAGGVPVTGVAPHLCLNPSAIVEVRR